MRTPALFLVCLVCLAAWLPAGAASEPPGPAPRISLRELELGYRDGTVLARPRPEVAADALLACEQALGLTLDRRIGRGRVRVLTSEAGDDSHIAAQNLAASGLYVYAEPDFLRKRHAIPDDPLFAEQWAHQNDGRLGGTVGADVSAPAAWDLRRAVPDVIVAVLDSGIRASHEDLAGNLWINSAEIAGNGIDDDGNGYIDDVHGINSLIAKGAAGGGDPFDDVGHGTAVASVIAAVGNNGRGIVGVAWEAKIMALKFDDLEGTTDGSSYVSNEIECIDYAIANGARVINISYGSHHYSRAEYEAVRQAGEDGVLVVAAAGNDGVANDVATSYPAGYPLPNVLAVANTDANDALAASSTYGGLVELAAPGTDLLVCGHREDDAYVIYSGTSFSSPMVAGALALMIEQFPEETPRGLINRLLRSVDSLPGLQGKVSTAGRLNLHRALSSSVNRPFNDDFAARASLAGESVITRGDSTGATREPTELVHGATGGASLWWSWTAPRGGTAVVDTSETDFDTMIAVYSSGPNGELTPVASNDDTPGRVTSRASFVATAGTAYHIAVEGKGAATGMVMLAVSLLPSNDDFANAITLTGLADQETGNNVNAQRQTGEPIARAYDETAVGSTVWYRWDATRNDDFTVAVQTESFNPIVSVYVGSRVAGLTEVASDSTATSFRAFVGQTYWIAVDSLAPNAGTFTLSLLQAYLAVPFASSIPSSVAVSKTGEVVAVGSSGVVMRLTWEGDVWFRRIPGSVDVGTPALGTDGTIYVTSTLGLFALNPDQSMKWEARFDAGISGSPAVAADGTVYVHVDDGWLHAYSPAGRLKWKAAIPGVSYSSPSIGSDGTVYLGSDDGRVYAVTPIDGTIRWTYDTGGEVYASVTVGVGGTLYVGNLGGRFHAITSDGAQQWVYEAAAEISSSAALASDGTLYFGCYDHKLYALTAAGALKWTYETGGEIRGSSPLVDSAGTIYIGSYDKSLHAVLPTGTAKQTYPTGEIIRGSPALHQGSLIWTSGDGSVYFLYTGTEPAASPWPLHRQNSARTGRNAPTTAPVLLAQPESGALVLGQSTTLAVTVEGADPLTFQWYLNGVAIAGATESTYAIPSATLAHAGMYTVIVANGRGSVTSAAARVDVSAPDGSSRIINLSARAIAGAGSRTMIVGFVIEGSGGSKSMLIRSVGPTLGLSPFDLPGVLQNPRLTLFRGGAVLTENDDWAGAAPISAKSAQVGAFPFASPSSQDAALVVELGAGGYTAHVTAASGATSGVSLAEFYDSNPQYAAGQPRLLNISARAEVGREADALIVGFVIAGNASRTVLIRAVGPPLSLPPFNLSGVLPDPKVTLYVQGGGAIQSNDNWGSASELAELNAVMKRVGAFDLPAGSTDAAMLVTLPPGNYSAVVSDSGGATGVALAEVYDTE